MKLLFILFSLVIAGCDTADCPDSEKVEDGFIQTTWQDGSVTFAPRWVCGSEVSDVTPPILTVVE